MTNCVDIVSYDNLILLDVAVIRSSWNNCNSGSKTGIFRLSHDKNRKKEIGYRVNRLYKICACVFEPNIDCPIDFAFVLTFDTINGSAGIYVY